MPTALEHHDWADFNARFYAHLGGDESSWQPWAMTALFYIAVHEIQSFLVQHNLARKTHSERLNALRKDSQWATLAQHYDALQQRSRDARYECRVHSQADLAIAELALRQVRGEVARLRPSPP